MPAVFTPRSRESVNKSPLPSRSHSSRTSKAEQMEDTVVDDIPACPFSMFEMYPFVLPIRFANCFWVRANCLCNWLIRCFYSFIVDLSLWVSTRDNSHTRHHLPPLCCHPQASLRVYLCCAYPHQATHPCEHPSCSHPPTHHST